VYSSRCFGGSRHFDRGRIGGGRRWLFWRKPCVGDPPVHANLDLPRLGPGRDLDRLIRPGKGNGWVLTLIITPGLILFPVFIVIAPMLLLSVQYLKARPKREPRIRPEDRYEIWETGPVNKL